jgi:glucose/arabinose dehydrogenase/cytochrome c553
MRTQIRLLTGVLFLLAAACNNNKKVVKADPDNGGLLLPDQFEALVVVDSIGSARHIAVNDNGDIYVKLTYNEKMNGRGGTVGLRDLDGDGKADSVTYFGDYKDVGSSAVGMTIHNGYLYTSTVTQVLRTKLTPGKLIPENKTDVMLTDVDSNVAHNWHTTKPVAFDKKGNMYVPFGTPTDAGQDITKYGPVGLPGGAGLQPVPDLENHGGIWRFDASRINQFQKDGVRISTGIRSIVGMQWNNQDDHLYAVVNGIDNFHTMYPNLFDSWQAAVLPAELLIRADEGTNYGWPYAYYDQIQKKTMVQPGYGGDGKMVAKPGQYTEPVIGFPGHWAPMDVLFYEGDQFPERYKNGAFIAFHGSTDRSPYPQAGYIVCFVPFKNGTATGNVEIFADGFTGIDTVVNTNDAKYRPMGLSVGPDGSLYIVESEQGKIWRIMYKGDKKAFSDTQLVAMEKRKERTYIKTPDPKLDNLQTGDALEGSILYNTYCARCHSRNGMGDNSRFPPLVESPVVMGDKNLLISIVLNGLQGSLKVGDKTFSGIMPAHKNILDDHAIASITTYVRRRFGKRGSGVKTTEVKALRTPNATTQSASK